MPFGMGRRALAQCISCLPGCLRHIAVHVMNACQSSWCPHRCPRCQVMFNARGKKFDTVRRHARAWQGAGLRCFFHGTKKDGMSNSAVGAWDNAQTHGQAPAPTAAPAPANELDGNRPGGHNPLAPSRRLGRSWPPSAATPSAGDSLRLTFNSSGERAAAAVPRAPAAAARATTPRSSPQARTGVNNQSKTAH